MKRQFFGQRLKIQLQQQQQQQPRRSKSRLEQIQRRYTRNRTYVL